jgi:hypothetical protein
MGIDQLPAASGTSLWFRITIEPPVPIATCLAAKWSAGHDDTTDAGIALRLNQYGNWMSSTGIVPVACRIMGFRRPGWRAPRD